MTVSISSKGSQNGSPRRTGSWPSTIYLRTLVLNFTLLIFVKAFPQILSPAKVSMNKAVKKNIYISLTACLLTYKVMSRLWGETPRTLGEWCH